MRGRARAWVSERFPVPAIEEFAESQAKKLMPANVSWWHTFGSLALFLMLNQIVTGILLMVYYRPTAETAFESVKFITTKAQFGWLIRGLHSWGATLMIATLLLHMVRTFLMGAFKKPRELTWVVGVVIFGLTLIFGFTGYLLPWNQVAYWATTVGTEVTGAIPWVGEFTKYLLRGGEGIGEETLARFYVLHVVVLPWLLVVMVVLHIVLMRMQGLSPPEPVGKEIPLTEKTGIHFYPEHVLKEMTIFPIFFLALLAVVILFPPELGEKADPFVTPEGIKPEWYFLPTYQMLKYMPKMLGLLVSVVPIVALFLWPFLDRTAERRASKRPVSVAIGMSALVLPLLFGLVGYMSERTIIWRGQTYHIDQYGIPHRVESPARATAPEKALPLQDETPRGGQKAR